ncbi:XRE family transcriptional regulator [Salmonella enterica subsp. enterica]|nr:XRE family transcriptional regulator [Salmonella enterica subsp. enterica serovar Hartford]
MALIATLRSARESLGLTQVQLSERINRSQSYVAKYENNERSLKLIEFIEICEALNISPSEVIKEITNDYNI